MPKTGQLGKFGTDKKEAYLELLRKGGRRCASAVAVGVCRETVRLHIRDDKEFAKAVSEAEMQANELMEDALFIAGMKGNVVAIQVWLYNRDPKRWADRRKHEVEHKGEVNLYFHEKAKDL